MIKVLFICHGNICRSTMAQSIFAHMAAEQGLSESFYIDSAATSREEIGNPPHYGTVGKLRQVGIPLVPHRARQMTKQDYKEFDRICEPIKYLFWRLECFCLGLERIMQNGHVAVEKDIFEHMKEIRKQIKKDNKKGCIWEEDWDCLLEPKMDVGEFYNRPELVFEKKTQQKLETTIDFVQNYYYYNRFKMMEEVKESGGQWDSDKDQVCRESAGDLSAY